MSVRTREGLPDGFEFNPKRGLARGLQSRLLMKIISTPDNLASATASARKQLPANAERQADALAKRAGLDKSSPARAPAVDVFDAVPGTTNIARGPRDNGIMKELEIGGGPGAKGAPLGGAAKFGAAKAAVDAMRDQVRDGLASAGIPARLGGGKSGAFDPLAARKAALESQGGTDPTTDAPGLSGPGSLLGARTAGEYGRSRTSDGWGESLAKAWESAKEHVTEFAISVASNALGDFGGPAAEILLSTRDEASLRDVSNGISGVFRSGKTGTSNAAAADQLHELDESTARDNKKISDPYSDRGDGPSEAARERAAQKSNGLIDPVSNDARELDPAKLAAATVISIMSKVNPAPDAPAVERGPIVGPESGVSDPVAPAGVKGGKIVVAGGPPRSGGHAPIARA